MSWGSTESTLGGGSCATLGAAESRGVLTMGSQLDVSISRYEGSARIVQVGVAMVDQELMAGMSRSVAK